MMVNDGKSIFRLVHMPHPDVTNPLVRKLGSYARLSREDHDVLLAATSRRARQLSAGEYLVRMGERPRAVNVVLSGWAYRYRKVAEGRRQIVALLLPGDVCDHKVLVLRAMDHSIAALTAVTVAEVSGDEFEALTAGRPHIAEALHWDMLASVSVQREWLVNLGRRSALERVAHLFCEVSMRLRAIGLETRDGLPFPLTQIDLADALGLSAVHVNRTLQDLRSRGLLHLSGQHLSFPDFDALAKLALFSPAYLHLANGERHLDAS